MSHSGEYKLAMMQIEQEEDEMSKVDHPKHYNIGTIEVINIIDDWELGFYEGNIVKYVMRSKYKGKQVQDLEKAKWYLDRLLEIVKAQ